MLKSLFFFLLITTVVLSADAQKLKKKTNTERNYKEVYFIDKKSKLMQGPYSKVHLKTKTEVASGEFTNAMRSGLWTFKDAKTDKVQLQYNFTDNKLVFIDEEQYPDSFLIYRNGEFVYDKVDRPLVFIGFKKEEQYILGTSINVPRTVHEMGLSGTSIIQFLVDEKGNIGGSKIISSFNKEMEQQVATVVGTFYGRFLPAIVDGKAVQSSFYVRLNIANGQEQIVKNIKTPTFIIDIDINFFSSTTTRAVGTTTRRSTGSSITRH